MNVNRLLIGLLLLCTTVSLYASEAEKIRRHLPSMTGKNRLQALAKLCVLSQEEGDYDEQWRCLADYMQEAHRQGDRREESDARMMRMFLFYNYDQSDSVYYYAPADLDFLAKSKEWLIYYRVWSALVNTYVYDGSVTTGLQEAQRMFADAMERNNEAGMGLAYSVMGNAYFTMNNMEEASVAYEKSIDILMKQRPLSEDLPNLFSSRCDVLERLHDYESLQKMTLQWNDYLQQLMKDWGVKEDNACMTQYWAYYYLGCAQAAIGLGRLDEAAAMLQEARQKIFTEEIDTYRSWLFYKARLSQMSQQPQQALAYNDSLMHLMAAIDDKSELIRVRDQRAQLMTLLGRDREAAALYREMYVINDSVNSHDVKRQLAEMNTIFKVDELKMQQAREQMRSIVIIASLIVLGLVVFIYFRQRAAKRLKVAHTKLEETHSQLLTAYDQLEETTTAKERIESDLRIARNIQMGMVPHTFPERDDVDLYASMTPAKEVGGDLYDYLIIGDKLYFCLGDVSGKGVPASLFMAMARNMFHVLAQQDLQPAEIATRMNNALSEDNESSMFVTMFIGVADLHTGHLGFCNAGHNPPVLIDQGTTEFVEMIPNAPIGLWPGLDYEGEEIGDITGRPLFVYTDGLNEAENRQQEQFTDERLLELLASTPFESSRQTIEMLRQEVEKHRDGAEPNDDLTMLCVKVTRK
jgi:serine phosphatase RsbU (regulator of sigma subunit)